LSENTITVREQATALATIARGSDNPAPVLGLLKHYLGEQPNNDARRDLMFMLVAALAHMQGQAIDLLQAISDAQQNDDES